MVEPVADLTVICVKWGRKYGADYVRRLHSMVGRHLRSCEFVCVTDDPVETVQCVPLACGYPGWWQKIGLFRPGLFPGDNLYLDLDVVITGSLEPLAALLDIDRSTLWARDDFSYSLVNPRKGIGAETQRLLGGPGCINSSVMLWHGDACRSVWDDFTPEVMDVLHGDQNWISQRLWPDINLIPADLVGSYKYHGFPHTVTVFHGEPKPHQVSDSWVREHWR